MAKIRKRLEHARHNDKAFRHFDKNPDFLDWVITIAFYSSLHYVKYQLFPLDEVLANNSKKRHNTFDDYCRYHKNKKLSKHELILDLVISNLPEISFEYNQLKDMCWTARYYEYQADRTMSNLAKSHQTAIKNHCEDLSIK